MAKGFEVGEIVLLSRPMERLIDHLGISLLIKWIIAMITHVKKNRVSAPEFKGEGVPVYENA